MFQCDAKEKSRSRRRDESSDDETPKRRSTDVKERRKESGGGKGSRSSSRASEKSRRVQEDDKDNPEKNKYIVAAKEMLDGIKEEERIALKSFFTRATNKLPRDNCAFTDYFKHISTFLNLLIKDDGTLFKIRSSSRHKTEMINDVKNALKRVQSDYTNVDNQIKQILKQLVEHMKEEEEEDESDTGSDTDALSDVSTGTTTGASDSDSN